MIRHTFTLDGVNCREYGIVCSGDHTFNAPSRDIERVVVPGRNGELTIDNGRYENIKVVYPAFIVDRFRFNAAAARAWLCSSPGYRRIEDDYNPDTYRMGRFVSGLDVETNFRNTTGEFDITFDCAPQRWLKSGEVPITVNSGEGITIHNPTNRPAYPLITGVVSAGAGMILINRNVLYLSDIAFSAAESGSFTIDCEAKRAFFNDGTSGKISGGWLALNPGDNTISVDSGAISSIAITPRWWTV